MLRVEPCRLGPSLASPASEPVSGLADGRQDVAVFQTLNENEFAVVAIRRPAITGAFEQIVAGPESL